MMLHHPSEAMLMACVAGSLPTPHLRVLEVHFALCRSCVESLQEIEDVAGGLLATLPPATLAPDALERTLARLELQAGQLDPMLAPAVGPRRAPTISNQATVARDALAELATGTWRWRGPRIAMMPLMKRDATGSRLDLIRVGPDTALLEHGHTGVETTVVLQGAFNDGIETYRPGDFAEADGTLDHQPRALAGEDCICLIATSGRLSARSLLGRLVRPLIGM